MITNAVFQGGGVKGIALIGALDKIEEAGIEFASVSGTSAGSIVASLYAAGYSASEMSDILRRTPLSELLDPFYFPYLSWFHQRGLYKGDKLYKWIYGLLAEKGIFKFKDIPKIELKIVAADLTKRSLLIFDANSYPETLVAEAVRMSISIPFFFKPIGFGSSLVVDGGVLSNFPLFTSKDPDTTLGFKICSNPTKAPSSPKSMIGFITAIVNTMMDAHDKHEEEVRFHKNTIEIDDSGFSSVDFELSEQDQQTLYNNGYYAASKFLTDNAALLTKNASSKVTIKAPLPPPLVIEIPASVSPNESVRISISTLFRILVDGKYLLIRGKRIEQFQPVGGVLKRLESSKRFMADMGVSDDDKFPIDTSSRNDLRVRVPFTSLTPFLEWFVSEKDRETSPWREFYEELVETQIVDPLNFKSINYEYIRTHVEGIRFSPFFTCHEILIAEIYELIPSVEQAAEFRDLQSNGHPEIMWFGNSLILSRGFDNSKGRDVAKISETSKWIL